MRFLHISVREEVSEIERHVIYFWEGDSAGMAALRSSLRDAERGPCWTSPASRRIWQVLLSGRASWKGQEGQVKSNQSSLHFREQLAGHMHILTSLGLAV